MLKNRYRALLRGVWTTSLGMALAAVFLVVATSVVFAEPQKMSAREAHSASLSDDLIILDIRSPGEWDETGVAEGAWPVTMHDPGFGKNLQRILRQNPDKTVALICATGGRSNHVVNVLEQNGLSGVIDISEGMLGNGEAPGWVARGLPVVDVDTARNDLAQSLSK